MNYIKSGETKKAIFECNQLLKQSPNNTQIQLTLAIAHAEEGNLVDSKRIFGSISVSGKSNYHVLFNYGLVLQNANDFQSATAQYDKCLAMKKDFAPAWNNLGICQIELQSYSRAVVSFQNALSIEPQNINYYRSLADALFNDKQYTQAYKYYINLINSPSPVAEDTIHTIYCLLEMHLTQSAYELCLQSLNRFPGHPEITSLYARILLKLKHYKKAIQTLEPLINSTDFPLEDQFQLLTAYFHIDDAEKKKDLIQSLLSDSENKPHIDAFLINLLEKNNDIEQAKKLLSQSGQATEEIQLMSANISFREKKYKQALEQLNSILLACNSNVAIDGEFLLGNIHDKLSQYPQAWEHYTQANTLLSQKTNNQELFDGFTHNNKVILQQLTELYSKKINNYNQNTQTNGANLIFMIGFPRSGTTLLETSLDKHQKIQVLEETKEIANVFNHLCNNNPQNYSRKIQSMGSEDFNGYAKAYYKRIKQYIQWNEKGFIIDKMPMNTVYIDLISRLFPQAKIIFSARHCYDVCLSNFFQKDIHLYNMDEVFSTYDSVLSIWKLAKDHINLDLTTCYYENLINNKQAEIQNLLNFIGLDTSELSTTTGNKRMVNTPSYAQVNEPIYQTSINRYLNYLPFFPKHLSNIDKWIAFLNYKIN